MSRYRPRTPKSVRIARGLVVTAAACATALGLSACGGGDSSAAQPSKGPVASKPADAVTVVDPWVKAADSGMTAAFGTLRNNTDAEITVVSVSSPLSPMELHEVVADGDATKMRQKEGGFVIPARGSHELKPGGDHLMLMKLAQPVKAGDQVTFTLTLKDGRTVQFAAAAKPFAGAKESYAPGDTQPPAHG